LAAPGFIAEQDNAMIDLFCLATPRERERGFFRSAGA